MTYDDDVVGRLLLSKYYGYARVCCCALRMFTFFLPRKSKKTFIVKMPPGILKLQPRNIELVRVV